MTSHGVFRSMVWKDYRELRVFWITAVLMAIGLDALVGLMTRDRTMVNYTLIPMLGWALVMPAVYALGCAATMFAGERESGTYHFLRALPVNPMRLLAARTAFVLATSLLMLVVTIAAYLVLKRWLHVEADDIAETLGLFAITPNFELFVWGVLFSLVCRRPLAALILGGTFGGGAPLLVGIQFHLSADPRESAADWWLPALAWRLAIVVLVAAVDAWLAARWFRDGGALQFKRRRPIPAGALAQASADSDRPSSTTTKTTSEFGRLLWQQWRQSRRVAGLFGAATLVLAVLFWVAGPPHGDPEDPGALLLLLLLPLIGVYVFREDWWEERFRFLAERGATPGRVWLTRQSVWFALSVLILLLLLIAVLSARFHAGNRHFSSSVHAAELHGTPAAGLYACYSWFVDPLQTVSGEELFVFFLFAASIIGGLAAYACGQFCSILTRSSIVATMASFGLLVAMVFWAGIMSALSVNWLWSVVPIPLALLLATRLHTRDWMLGRGGWRVWARILAVPILPVVATLVVIPFYRVYSVPQVDLRFPPEAAMPRPTPEGLATARMYAEAHRQYEPLVVQDQDFEDRSQEKRELWDYLGDPSYEGFDRRPLPAKFVTRLKANRRAIELTLQASRRPEYSSASFRQPGGIIDPSEIQDLGRLLVVSARQLTIEGRLDDAMDRYLAAIRVANHLKRSEVTDYGYAYGLYGLAEWGLLNWAAHPKQTDERIERALEEFTKIEIPSPPLVGRIKWQWMESLKELATGESWRRPSRYSDSPEANFVRLVQFAAVKWLPWERTRARRVIDYAAYHASREVQRAESALRNGEQIDLRINAAESEFVESLMENTGGVGGSHYLCSPRSANGLIHYLAHRTARDRAFRLQMALAAWRREHGKLPQSLDKLVGTYLDALPVDPFTGRSFDYYPEGVAGVVEDDQYNREYAARDRLAHGPFIWSPRNRAGYSALYSGDEISIYIIREGWIFPIP